MVSGYQKKEEIQCEKRKAGGQTLPPPQGGGGGGVQWNKLSR